MIVKLSRRVIQNENKIEKTKIKEEKVWVKQ